MRVLPFDNTKSSMSASELVEEISKKVPRQVQIDILRETFPQGKVTGDLFTIGSTSGESGKSLKIDINPRSPYFMKGQDFNGGVGIGGVLTGQSLAWLYSVDHQQADGDRHGGGGQVQADGFAAHARELFEI